MQLDHCDVKGVIFCGMPRSKFKWTVFYVWYNALFVCTNILLELLFDLCFILYIADILSSSRSHWHSLARFLRRCYSRAVGAQKQALNEYLLAHM